ncbi:MAG TPA: XdhC family protein, partial [Candidatus Acidoferrum sp.]|nr:XdhC family protein [Candidatus Acidoferrum sp.]
MNSLDQQVLNQLAQWLEAGKHCWLCTITDTFGSSPRPIGSLLACNEDGLHCGSLSGGCVEDNLRESLFKGELAKTAPAHMKYGVAVEDVLKLGLPCGGSMQVFIEPIAPDQAPRYRVLADKVERRELVQREVDIHTGEWTMHDVARYHPLELTDATLRHCYGPSFQLLLVGAVQVAWYL